MSLFSRLANLLPRTVSISTRVSLVLIFVAMVAAFGAQHRQQTSGQLRVPTITEGDGAYSFFWLRSFGVDGDADLRDEFQLFGNSWGFSAAADGRTNLVFPPGPAFLRLPFYMLARALCLGLHAVGVDVPLHGHTLLEQYVALFSSVLAGFLAFVLAFLKARSWFGERPALLGATFGLLATNLFLYSTGTASFTHALTAGGAALFLYYWLPPYRTRPWRRSVWCGLGIGLAALARFQEVLWLLLPAIETCVLLFRAERHKERALVAARGLLCAAIAFLCLMPQLILNARNFGSPFATPQGPAFMRWATPAFWEILYSTRNGLFVWTPAAYLGMLGLLLVPRRLRLWLVGVFFVFVLEVYVNGCAWDWWAGVSFSQRRLASFSMVFMLGLSALACKAIAGWKQAAGWRRCLRRASAITALLLALVLVGWSLRVSYDIDMRTGRVQSGVVQSMYNHKLLGSRFEELYRAIGYPFAYPANLIFSLRYGLAPGSFDKIFGRYYFECMPDEFTSGRYRTMRAKIDLERSDLVSRRDGQDRSSLQLAVPLFLAGPQRWTVSAAANERYEVHLRINGHELPARFSAKGVANLEWEIADGLLGVGLNRVELASAGPARFQSLLMAFSR